MVNSQNIKTNIRKQNLFNIFLECILILEENTV